MLLLAASARNLLREITTKSFLQDLSAALIPEAHSLLANSHNTFIDIQRILPVYGQKVHDQPAWSFGVYIVIGTHSDGSSILYSGSTNAMWHRIHAHKQDIKNPRRVSRRTSPSYVNRVLARPGWEWKLHVFAKLTTMSQEQVMSIMETIAIILFGPLCFKFQPESKSSRTRRRARSP